MAEAGTTIEKTVDAWRDEAHALEDAGRVVDAERLLAKIIEAKPDYHPALHQAALLAFRRKNLDQATARFERALALAPDNALYHRNVCEIYRIQSRLDEALRHAEYAVKLDPGNAAGHYNLAVIRYDGLEIAAALASIRRALAIAPQDASAHFEFAEALLLSGQFEEGWREYEWRFDLPNAPRLLPPNNRPLWDGKPMPRGTLLLIGDQGFGDTIQFCRYIPMAHRRCPNIAVAASAEMHPVVMQQEGVARCYDRWHDVPAFDAYCSLSGLPRIFGTDLSNIPAPIPYLKADREKAARWRARLDPLTPENYRRIGLVWAGRPTHGNDFNRSIGLKRLLPLAKLKNFVFISLQMGPARAEIGKYFGAAPLINLGAEISDFGDTMAILDGLDRLIAVDTGVAHLAGAMGKAVSVLLPYAPDWRWLLGRCDSPWYPTMRLHRQDAPGDWGSAVGKAVRLLAAEVGCPFVS
ncbi:MAG: tetratricopeptide repeat protein [Rhizomicrobium sp.]